MIVTDNFNRRVLTDGGDLPVLHPDSGLRCGIGTDTHTSTGINQSLFQLLYIPVNNTKNQSL